MARDEIRFSHCPLFHVGPVRQHAYGQNVERRLLDRYVSHILRYDHCNRHGFRCVCTGSRIGDNQIRSFQTGRKGKIHDGKIAPYLLAQDIGFVLGLVALTFSGAFFFSVLFRKQALSALAGIILLTAYLAWRGIGGFRKIYGFETLEADTLILVFLIAGMFFGSLFAFRVREF
jgi:hypothetical protein